MSDNKTVKKADAKETCIFDGVLKSAFTHQQKNDAGEVTGVTHVIQLFPDGLKIDDSEKVWEFFDGFYNGVASKWVPEWYKEKKGVTVKSNYDIPVKIVDTDERFSFPQFVDRGMIRNAKVLVKCNIKESALYPIAMKIVEDGEVYDAFKDF